MTELELTDVLLTILSKTTGRSRGHWRRTLGPMTRHPLSTHPRCNWSFSLSGSTADMDAAGRALDVVREAHPLVLAG